MGQDGALISYPPLLTLSLSLSLLPFLRPIGVYIVAVVHTNASPRFTPLRLIKAGSINCYWPWYTFVKIPQVSAASHRFVLVPRALDELSTTGNWKQGREWKWMAIAWFWAKFLRWPERWSNEVFMWCSCAGVWVILSLKVKTINRRHLPKWIRIHVRYRFS